MTGMINIGTESVFAYCYKGGEWNIVLQKEVNPEHHLAKADAGPRFITENYGDLNRCIAATPRYRGEYDRESYLKIRRAYIAALQEFKKLKGIPFEEKFSVTVTSLSHGGEHKATTNKNHRGVKYEYVARHRHKTDKAYVQRTESNYHRVAESLFGIEVGEFITENEDATIDEIVEFMVKATSHIVSTIGDVVLPRKQHES